MSTLKVNSLDTESGTTITVPTGKVFTITDAGGVAIGGTVVSSTAAELNVLDGIPGTLTAVIKIIFFIYTSPVQRSRFVPLNYVYLLVVEIHYKTKHNHT